MVALRDICSFLDQFAPAVLAEEWDNVGLLTGDPEAAVRRIMTCLTVTPQSAAEAVEKQADLVVTHHPLPFRPIKRLTADSTPGKLLWHLTTHRIAIYSPHTAFDSAASGINRQLAEGLDLLEIEPLLTVDDAPIGTGAGRFGRLAEPRPLAEIAARLKQFLAIPHLHFVGDLDRSVCRVAVACGAAGQLLSTAQRAGCDLLVLGETNLHTCLEADALGLALLLPGHFASERFAVEQLADDLASRFAELEVWASDREKDPLRLY